MDAAFKENMTKEEAQDFVRKAISHAMARDGSSGGVIRMVVIDKTGVSVSLDKDSVQREAYARSNLLNIHRPPFLWQLQRSCDPFHSLF